MGSDENFGSYRRIENTIYLFGGLVTVITPIVLGESPPPPPPPPTIPSSSAHTHTLPQHPPKDAIGLLLVDSRHRHHPPIVLCLSYVCPMFVLCLSYVSFEKHTQQPCFLPPPPPPPPPPHPPPRLPQHPTPSETRARSRPTPTLGPLPPPTPTPQGIWAYNEGYLTPQ